MSNWTAELTSREPSDQDILDYVESTVADREETPSLIEEMQVKMAQAYQAGINLARSQGDQVFDNVLEKNAKIWGARAPNTIDHAAIPYEHRKADYEEYAHEKAREKPSGYLKGIGGGALIGGGIGAGLGALINLHAPGAGAAVNGGVGTLFGGLTGAVAAHRDKKNIESARRAVGGRMDRELAKRIADNHDDRRSEDWWDEERRHQSLMSKRAEAEKVAWIPAALAAGRALLPGAAKAVGGQVAKKGIGTTVGGMAKQMGKDVLVDGATNMASNAFSRARQPAQQAAPAAGGFKYAKAGGAAGLVSNLSGQAKNLAGSVGGKGAGTFGQKLVGGMVRNPGAALIGAGALGGAIMAPRDPVTGEKQYLKGALRGGVVGGGAYALGGGNALRKAVVNPKGPQIFGEQAGAYARNAAKVTAPSAAGRSGTQAMKSLTTDLAGHAAPAAAANRAAIAPELPAPTPASFQVPVLPKHVSGPASTPGPSVQVDPKLMKEHDALARRQAQIRNVGTGGGGSVQTRGLLGGQVQTQVPGNHTVSGEMKAKFANRQTLTYDPATKSFTRTHLTADTTMGTGAGDVLPAGHREMVTGHQAESVPRGPAPTGLRPSPGPSQVFTSAGGNVMSSAPAAGAAARPQVSARPMAAPPPIPAAARMKSPIAAGAGAAMRAAPKAPSLPSLAGARSLVRR